MILSCFECRQIVGYLREDGAVDLSTVERPDWSAVSGDFVIVNGLLVALYRRDDELRVRVGRDETVLRAGAVERTVVGRRAKVSVRSTSGERLAWAYDLPVLDPPLSLDPTPRVNEEHYDFGLFLLGVSGDPERIERMFRVP